MTLTGEAIHCQEEQGERMAYVGRNGAYWNSWC